MTQTMELPMTDDTVSGKGIASCQKCGLPIDWAGRGRKPAFHPGCKPTADRAPKSAAGAKAAGQSVSNAQLDLAVGNIDNLYTLMTTALFALGAHQAAQMLAGQVDQLNAGNREFLAHDAKLVALLNKGAAITGRGGFLATNLAVLGPVVMTAVAEVNARAASKREPGAQ